MRVKITPREKRRLSSRRVSPFLAWGDFHARSRFARSTIPEEKWGTTRSLKGEQTARGIMKEGKCGSNVISHLVVPRSILLSLFTGMRYNRIQTVNSKTSVQPNLDPDQGWIHRAT